MFPELETASRFPWTPRTREFQTRVAISGSYKAGIFPVSARKTGFHREARGVAATLQGVASCVRPSGCLWVQGILVPPPPQFHLQCYSCSIDQMESASISSITLYLKHHTWGSWTFSLRRPKFNPLVCPTACAPSPSGC